MRIDEIDHSQQPPEDRPAPRTSSLSKPWMAALILMVPATSLALTSVSAWLVPPYLGLLAWLVLVPALGRPRSPARSESPEEPSGDPANSEAAGDASADPEPETAEELSAVNAPSESDGAVATKPKRSRARTKAKAKATVPPEPLSVSWVQVGPGKFVRVEGAAQPVASPPEPPEAEGSRDAATAPSEGPAEDLPAVVVEVSEPQDETTSMGMATGPSEDAPDDGEVPTPPGPEAQAPSSWPDGDMPARVEGDVGRIDPSEPESPAEDGPRPPAQDEASAGPWGEETPPMPSQTPPANGVVTEDVPAPAEAPEVEEAATEVEEGHHDEHLAETVAIGGEGPSHTEEADAPELPQCDAAPTEPEPSRDFEFLDVSAVATQALDAGESSPRVERSSPRHPVRLPVRSLRAQPARSRRPRRPAGAPRARSGRGEGRIQRVPRAYQPRAPPSPGYFPGPGITPPSENRGG